MKSVLVICGAGCATSTVAMSKIEEWIREKGYSTQVRLKQSSIAEQLNKLTAYDAVITMTALPKSAEGNIINGFPLLTGMGEDGVYQELERYLQE